MKCPTCGHRITERKWLEYVGKVVAKMAKPKHKNPKGDK